jgi:hypothetical protein
MRFEHQGLAVGERDRQLVDNAVVPSLADGGRAVVFLALEGQRRRRRQHGGVLDEGPGVRAQAGGRGHVNQIRAQQHDQAVLERDRALDVDLDGVLRHGLEAAVALHEAAQRRRDVALRHRLHVEGRAQQLRRGREVGAGGGLACYLNFL